MRTASLRKGLYTIAAKHQKGHTPPLGDALASPSCWYSSSTRSSGVTVQSLADTFMECFPATPRHEQRMVGREAEYPVVNADDGRAGDV